MMLKKCIRIIPIKNKMFLIMGSLKSMRLNSNNQVVKHNSEKKNP